MAKKESILTDEQIAFLLFIGSQKYFRTHYYLTGGTPLAAFYLHHRYSEDLDFFTEDKEVDIRAVQQLMHRAKEKCGFKKISYAKYYGLYTFFLEYPQGTKLKVDFNYYPFKRIEAGETQYNFAVDSLKDIAVNKIQSIATRTNARDFIDLFFICKEKKYDIEELLKLARNKFDWYTDPLQFGKQLIKAPSLKDFPRMIKKIDDENFIKFFENEAKKLGNTFMKA